MVGLKGHYSIELLPPGKTINLDFDCQQLEYGATHLPPSIARITAVVCAGVVYTAAAECGRGRYGDVLMIH
ncbi:hypothetical protein EVAR_59025_1 [Eumeta japonica]|uniref:Uncharacterized protein n=1 Tax=Eumeta variegata TaxID=151549 RepID=A0A4C1ZES9_EUMVA|nr:hypothetical protein EVAR_59025_1 [Eumeta japonica]